MNLVDFNNEYAITPVESATEFFNKLSSIDDQYGHVNLRENINAEQNSKKYNFKYHYWQAVVEYKPLNKYIGAIRLFFLDLESSQKKLPIERKIGTAFYPWVKDIPLPRDQLAEVNIFTFDTHFRPKFAIIGLLRALMMMVQDINVNYFMIAMDHHLCRSLFRIGLTLPEISPILMSFQNHACFLGSIHETLEQIYKYDKEIWNVITLNGELWPEHDSSYKNEFDNWDELPFNYM